jgi:hypothetical protein
VHAREKAKLGWSAGIVQILLVLYALALAPRALEYLLDPFLEGAAVHQYTPATDLAFQADVGANAHYPPLVAAAWVWLT